MKAFVVIQFEQRISQAMIASIEATWREKVTLGFSEPLVVSGGTVQMFYLPDNFSASNIYTEAELAKLIELLRAAREDKTALLIGEPMGERYNMTSPRQARPNGNGWLCRQHYGLIVPEAEVLTLAQSYPAEECQLCARPGEVFVSGRHVADARRALALADGGGPHVS